MGAGVTVANLLKQISGDSATPTAADCDEAVRGHSVTVMKPGAATSGDDAAAGTDITETPIWSNDTGAQITITGITYRCGATGIIGADATAPTLTIFKRDSAGANQVSVGSFIFNLANGTFTTGMRATFTLSAVAGALQLPAGSCLTLTKTHAGAGIVIPGGGITIRYTKD